MSGIILISITEVVKMKGKILRKILGISLAAAMIMCTGTTAGAYTDFDQKN